MLDLASPRWHELTQAYGSAEDIPRLIGALASIDGDDARSELWLGAWATLCPEGRAVTAGYAAVPHLLAIAEGRGAAEQVTALHVATMVELARHLPGAPGIPPDLVAPYALAIESLPGRVASLMDETWDATSAQILAAALLAGKRQPALARALLDAGGETEG